MEELAPPAGVRCAFGPPGPVVSLVPRSTTGYNLRRLRRPERRVIG